MIDLHVHSTCSDGTFTPAHLARLGMEAGLSAMALTDHDTTEGLPAFLEAAAELGLVGVGGVELSTQGDGGGMHMLGYFIDPGYAPLQAELEAIRAGRHTRNLEILAKLDALGVPLSVGEAEAFSGGAILSRAHMARSLVQAGHVTTFQDAFRRYLGRGCPAYCDRYRPEPRACMALIRAAGGVPVLAHPGVERTAIGSIESTLRQLVPDGLQGVEVYYPQHPDHLVDQLEKLAAELGLVMTGGSDFHGDVTPDLVLGKGYGRLHVPDGVLDALERRRP